MGNKNFDNKADLKKYLKDKMNIVGDYSPQEFALEEAIDECQGAGFIERISYLRASKTGKELGSK
jgi:hypothetical protein